MFRQPCNVLVISWRYQTCQNDLVTGLICHQSCYKLLTACSKLDTTNGNKQCEHNLSTACEQIRIKNVCVFTCVWKWCVKASKPRSVKLIQNDSYQDLFDNYILQIILFSFKFLECWLPFIIHKISLMLLIALLTAQWILPRSARFGDHTARF